MSENMNPSQGSQQAHTLSRREFEVLSYLESLPDAMSPGSQRDIGHRTGMSVGSVNKTIATLSQLGFIEGKALTGAGRLALEPYRVKRMVILAAGFGSRLVPITLNTPKPLIRVKGSRIIDSLLDAACKAQIEEIYIVRGYFAEQFDQLLYKYPNIRFIENPAYNETNNISSALAARDLISQAYVCEADLLVYNPSIITKYQYASNYLGVPVDRSDDWCLFTDASGRITKIATGGIHCYHMFGISFWTSEDGAKLREHLPIAYEMPGGKERYWDQVALDSFVKEYSVGVRPCSFDDIIEIDTFRELKQLDSSYDT